MGLVLTFLGLGSPISSAERTGAQGARGEAGCNARQPEEPVSPSPSAQLFPLIPASAQPLPAPSRSAPRGAITFHTLSIYALGTI